MNHNIPGLRPVPDSLFHVLISLFSHFFLTPHTPSWHKIKNASKLGILRQFLKLMLFVTFWWKWVMCCMLKWLKHFLLSEKGGLGRTGESHPLESSRGCDSPVESKGQGVNSHHHMCDLHISKNYLSVHILDLEFHSNLSVVCRLAGLYFFFLCSCSNMVHAFILLPGTWDLV